MMSIGNFPEILSQAILAGVILVGRLGVGISPGLGEVPRQTGHAQRAPPNDHLAPHFKSGFIQVRPPRKLQTQSCCLLTIYTYVKNKYVYFFSFGLARKCPRGIHEIRQHPDRVLTASVLYALFSN